MSIAITLQFYKTIGLLQEHLYNQDWEILSPSLPAAGHAYIMEVDAALSGNYDKTFITDWRFIESSPNKYTCTDFSPDFFTEHVMNALSGSKGCWGHGSSRIHS